MHIDADKLRTDLRRLRAQLVRTTDKQTPMPWPKAYRKRQGVCTEERKRRKIGSGR
jgi:hypothetical protein